MSDLPRDMAEEVLCRIPVTSLRPVRSTCKKWNTLSRCGVFAKKHLAHQAKVAEEAKEDTLVVMVMDYRVYLMRFNLSNINNNNVESCVEREAKLTGPDGSDQIDVHAIFHCDGLLLCIPENHSRIVVWNPYWGQTRWIECTHNYHLQPATYEDKYTYALGYDSSSNSHKVLRFSDFPTKFVEFKIYEFSSDSWRILDLLPRDWVIGYGERGLTLKGNTYWFASERRSTNSFLVCFDFTRETFWSPLPLPFEDACREDTVSLSSVREDQLVVLFQPWDTLTLEIWISNKIDEPNAVSWNNKVFLSADIRQLIVHPQRQFPVSVSFLIDEEKKIALVFDKDKDIQNPTREVAYIIGVDGYFKEADVRECADNVLTALICSYVPSLVQLN
ncbi:hypothetical protein Bca52824_089892 [Brassica carinata]|uniref:F-box domain-containing protein n=1 Tax=Brassica carinata TaxID=52824 RepID=A0A8X7NTZ3_BRACI|nr:hypothetical protein Bca52824_089892 [Brassica carinata]